MLESNSDPITAKLVQVFMSLVAGTLMGIEWNLVMQVLMMSCLAEKLRGWV